MTQFFEVVFFISAIILIVLNILQLDKFNESRKKGIPIPFKWFQFIISSLAAIGCLVNVIAYWINN